MYTEDRWLGGGVGEEKRENQRDVGSDGVVGGGRKERGERVVAALDE